MMSLMTIARTVLTMSKPNLCAIGIKRDDYKAIKRMDRIQLSEYLSRVWKRGYDAGVKSVTVAKKTAPVEKSVEQPALQSAT